MSIEGPVVRETGAAWLTLFAPAGTLICCALPIALVALGLGAAVASLTSAVPVLITLSQHKAWVFAASALMLALSGWALFRPGRSCPADPALAAKCEAAHRWNVRVLAVSAVVWAIGFAAAYLSLPLLQLFDRWG